MNAVAGALETDKTIKNTDIFFIRKIDVLLKQIESSFHSYDIVVLGFSIFTTQFLEISKLIKKIRKRFGNQVMIIAGGPHPSGMPEQTLRYGIDVVFIGESENSIIDFITNLQTNQDYRRTKGIAFLDDNKQFLYNKKEYVIDLNQFPPFPQINARFGSIEISRGCPYKCYFCQTSFMLGTIPRYRSVETICKYITIMKEENLTDIRFIAPNAFSYGSSDGKGINLTKLEELLFNVRKIIGDTGRIFFGSFPSEVRPEHVKKETLNLIKTYADNDNIIIGAQSGSQNILDACNRGHTVTHIYRAVDETVKAGLHPNVDFLFGLPYENEQDVEQTIEVMKDLISKGARIHAHTFIPLPQTPFSKLKGTKITKKAQIFLREYNFRGHVYGNFRKQQKLVTKTRNLITHKTRDKWVFEE